MLHDIKCYNFNEQPKQDSSDAFAIKEPFPPPCFAPKACRESRQPCIHVRGKKNHFQ